MGDATAQDGTSTGVPEIHAGRGRPGVGASNLSRLRQIEAVLGVRFDPWSGEVAEWEAAGSDLRPQMLELVRAFGRIADSHTRETLLGLVQAAADPAFGEA